MNYGLLWYKEVVLKRIKMLLHLCQYTINTQNKHNLLYKQDDALHHFPSTQVYVCSYCGSYLLTFLNENVLLIKKQKRGKKKEPAFKRTEISFKFKFHLSKECSFWGLN